MRKRKRGDIGRARVDVEMHPVFFKGNAIDIAVRVRRTCGNKEEIAALRAVRNAVYRELKRALGHVIQFVLHKGVGAFRPRRVYRMAEIAACVAYDVDVCQIYVLDGAHVISFLTLKFDKFLVRNHIYKCSIAQ